MSKNILQKLFFSALFLALFLCADPVFAKEPAWGPWPQKSEGSNAKKNRSLSKGLFDFYQKYISSDDGAACPFYPTCSAYAYQAVGKHGFFYGGLLALDRLFSEYPGMPKSGLYPLITKYGLHRPYDPVP